MNRIFARRGKLSLAMQVLWIVSSAILLRQSLSAEPSNTQEQRLSQLVYRHPKRGTAFELWYQHHVDQGSLESLIESTERRARDHRDDYSSQVVWGLLCERLSRIDDARSAFCKSKKLDQGYYSRFLLGSLLFRQKLYEDATVEYENAIEFEIPSRDYLEIVKNLATCYLRTDQNDKARKTWQKIMARFETDTRVLSEIASWLASEQQVDDSMSIWKKIESLPNVDPYQRLEVQLNIAQLYFETGKFEEAVELLNRLLDRVEPQSWRATEIRRRIEAAILRQHGFPELIAFWEKRHEQKSDDLDTILCLARANSKFERNETALRNFQLAIRRGPGRRDIREALIEHLVRTDDFTCAVEHATVIAKQHASDADAWMKLGNLELRVPSGSMADRHRKAIQAWENIATIRPNDAGFAVEVAKACRSAIVTHQTDDEIAIASDATKREAKLLIETAEKYYREALRRNPTGVQYHEYLGEFLHWQGRSNDAVQAWQRMADQNTAEVWHQLSRVLVRFGYHQQAIDAGRKSLTLDEQNLSFRKDQVQLLIDAESFDEALAEADQLLKIAQDPRWEETAIRLRVRAVTAAKKIPEELQRLKLLTTRNRGNYQSHWISALLHFEGGNPVAAVNQFKAALDAAPDDVRLITNYATILERSNELDRALEQFRRLLMLDPTKKALHYRQIVSLELRRKDLHAAEDAVNQLIRFAPIDPEAFVLKSVVSLKAGDRNGQIKAMRRAVQLAPDDIQFRRQLVKTLADSGLQAKANLQAYRCFEMTDSSFERASILKSIIQSLRTRQENDALISKIRATRRRAKDPFPITMSLIDAYDLMNRRPEAFDELLQLQKRRPNERAILTRIVDYADAMNEAEKAVTYQQKLILMDDSSQALEKLARLYRRAGRLADATRVWDSILDKSMSEREVLDLVDLQIKQNALFQAQKLIEYGLAKNPENWQLLYLSGWVHLALHQKQQAARSFEAVLALQPQNQIGQNSKPNVVKSNAGRLSVPIFPVDYRELADALNANEKYMMSNYLLVRPRPTSRSQRAAASRIHTIKKAKTLADAQTDSLLALNDVYDMEENIDWIDRMISAENTDAKTLRMIMITCWSTHRIDYSLQTLQRVANNDPHDSLPHILRLISPRHGRAKNIEGDDIKTVIASFHWIRKHRPILAAELSDYYVSRLLSGDSQRQEVAKTEIELSATFGELTALVPLVDSVDSFDERQRLVHKAWNVYQTDPGKVTEQELQQMLPAATKLLEMQKTDGDAEVAFNFLAALLRAGKAEPSPNGSRSTAALQTLASSTVPSHIQNLVLQHKRSLELRLIVQAVKMRNMPRSQRTQSIQRLQLARIYGSVAPQRRRAPRRPAPSKNRVSFDFPRITSILDSSRFEFLQKITRASQKSGRMEQLLELLENQSDGRSAFRLAHAYVLWWNNDKDAAYEIMEGLCAEPDIDASVKLALVRAYLQGQQLRAAKKILNNVQMTSGNATEITHLNNTIANQWSHFAMLREFKGHMGAVSCLAFSADGKQLVSAGADATARVWDVATGNLVKTLRGHNDLVMAVAFSPDGKSIATAGYDDLIRIWNRGDYKQTSSLKGHSSTLRSISYSADNTILAAGGDDAKIFLWEVGKSELVKTLEGHTDAICSLEFAPRGNNLVSGSLDGTARIWSTELSKSIQTFEPKAGAVRCVGYFSKSHRIASGSDGRQLDIWERNGSWRKKTYVPHSAVRSLAISPQEELIALGCADHSVQIWNLATQTEQAEFHGHSARVLSVVFDPTGTFLASSSFDGSIKLWKTNLNEETDSSN